MSLKHSDSLLRKHLRTRLNIQRQYNKLTNVQMIQKNVRLDMHTIIEHHSVLNQIQVS